MKGKGNVLVLGMGKSGMAAAELLCAQGRSVFIYDDRREADFLAEEKAWLASLDVRLLSGDESQMPVFETVVMSPGISPSAAVAQKAGAEGAEIIGELELAYRSCDARFVAITGTNGKTTTTALVGEMYRLAGLPHEVVGNIGLPVSKTALSCRAGTTMVTEVSSFQLETTSTFHPGVSAVLNLAPDHLDRHGSMQAYVEAKAKIFANQTENDFFIYNADDERTRLLAERALLPVRVPFSRMESLPLGAYVREGKIALKGTDGREISLCMVSELLIPGTHNLENALAAAAIGYFAGIPSDVIRLALTTFAGVEHRIEFVCEKSGVRYVNDSKGTNPEASIKALEATDTPIVLIAGGYEKHSDFDEFILAFAGKVKYLLLLGVTAPRIAQSAIKLGFPEDRILFCETMKDCVQTAFSHAVAGDTVLLSPASASWGMYRNFEERGRDFKQLALSLPD